jgi:Pentapeptide repeats (8 copies)
MANVEHLALLQQGTAIWNDWRMGNPGSLPDLSGADLRKANLSGANLVQADLRGTDLKWANLSGADLSEANLWDAILCHANLRNANLSKVELSGALLIQADLCAATLTGSSVYGTAVWDIKVDDQTKQQNLIITPHGDSVITVDSIKVAQFIYLLLNNEEIRDVINTITSKAVLILGRFSDDRKLILNALRDALRDKGFLPIVFDFERPEGRDFTETIMTLAGMSCFVIADITNPRSAPLELQATVPDYMIPFVPILQDGESEFSMFSNLQIKYDWVLGTLEYDSSQSLIDVLDDAVINPALIKRHELELRKARSTPIRHVSDYRKHP